MASLQSQSVTMTIREDYKGRKQFYIEWSKDALIHHKKKEEMNKLVEFLETNYPYDYLKCPNRWNKTKGDKAIPATRLTRWVNNRSKIKWTIDYNGDSTDDVVIYIASWGDESRANMIANYRFHIFTTASYVETDAPMSGFEGYKVVDEIFKKHNGMSTNSAYGYIDGNKDPDKMNFIKRIQPMTLVWINPDYSCKRIEGYHKADASSMYPWGAAVRKLPDVKQEYVLDYEIDNIDDMPEYDFFIRSDGHIIERDGFDTRKIYNHPYANKMHKKVSDIIKPSEKKFTLCYPRAIADMKPVMEELYKNKEIPELRDKYKFAMVSFIGVMQSNTINSLRRSFKGITSAVIYLRCIDYIFKRIDYIEQHGGTILQIATDAISWIGPELPELTTNEKKLGNFVREYTNAECCYTGCGVYAIKDEEGFHIKMQGTDKTISKAFKSKMRSVIDIINAPPIEVVNLERIAGKYHDIFRYKTDKLSSVDIIANQLDF